MNLKVYEKTRYQNIYRHKKNKNYLIMISKPVKSSISSINGEKILKIEDALKIRDNPKIKLQKGAEVKYKDGFDELWDKYIYSCKYELKQSFNTYNKKEKIYNKHLKNKFKQLSKITKDDIIRFLNNTDTTEKQKNEILKALKAFFSWCLEENYIIVSPTSKIKNYKVEKSIMKYWLPEDVQKFFMFINSYIESDNFNSKEKEIAYRIKILVLLGFSLGDRIGETRALTFNSINEQKSEISITHSINYDTKSDDFLSSTKTYSSQRCINVSDKLIVEIKAYKYYLINELDYNISNDTLIFLNHQTNRPFSDATLRKDFYNICELADVPKIRMYDLRHTFVATMMSEEKELYLISEKLGHTSFSTTVNKYGHLSNKVRKEIAKVTDKYI